MAELCDQDKMLQVTQFAVDNDIPAAAAGRKSGGLGVLSGSRTEPNMVAKGTASLWPRGRKTAQAGGAASAAEISRAASAQALQSLEHSIDRSPRPSTLVSPAQPRVSAFPVVKTPDWRWLPSALEIGDAPNCGPLGFGGVCERRELVVFLDYDGTLTPIVKDPAKATLSAGMREAVKRLATTSTVAVVSGRAREKIREFVSLDELYYAGSHGFDIDGPGGLRHSVSAEIIPVLAAAREALVHDLADVPGASVEDNRFAVSVHWRNVDDARRPAVSSVVDRILARSPFAGALKKSMGKCVYELKPNVKWDKGEAVLYLLELLRKRASSFEEYGLGADQEEDGDGDRELPPPPPPMELDADHFAPESPNGAAVSPSDWYRGVLPVYVGDDTTDEDAFKALKPFGAVTVLVTPNAEKADERPKATYATHTLKDVDEVNRFLAALTGARW